MAPGATDGAVGGRMDASPFPASSTPSSSPSSSSPPPITWANILCLTRHPVAAFFHVAFKAAALVLYLFQGLLGLEYVTVFISLTLLLAADFWVVKNVTGRLLVGLRWWARVKDDGSSEWVFESSPAHASKPALDRRLFWWALYTAPILFALFFVAAFLSLSFDHALVASVAGALTGANLAGYVKCSSDAQKRLEAAMQQGGGGAWGGAFGGALPALGAAMGSSVLSSLFAAGGGGAAAAAAAAAVVASAGGLGGGAGAAPGGGAVAPSLGGRSYAARSGPGISDADAVSDPFGSRQQQI
jgi:hypothetical protein